MSDFNPTRAAELAAMHEECDKKATKEWRNGYDPSHWGAPEVTDGKTFAYYVPDANNAEVIAALRNSSRETAEQLRAAIAEVERLRVFEDGMTALRERAKSFGLSPGQFMARFLHVDAEFDKLETERDALTRERDELRAEVERLRMFAAHSAGGLSDASRSEYDRMRKEVERMRAVYEAATEWGERCVDVTKEVTYPACCRRDEALVRLRSAIDAALAEGGNG